MGPLLRAAGKSRGRVFVRTRTLGTRMRELRMFRRCTRMTRTAGTAMTMARASFSSRRSLGGGDNQLIEPQVVG